ncbi:helix-turn-helix domain-containing protein [Streptomyces sp. NPDC088147]|uniref:helix-turn-helix domain-containing protein n=1 Tax=unclassified Streptomyces TaxID=2593676 RepID=UPI0037FFE925
MWTRKGERALGPGRSRRPVSGRQVPTAGVAPAGSDASAEVGRAMASTGHTLRTLADSTGVTHSTVSRVLNGKVMPDLGTLARLEAAFGFQLWPGPAALPPDPSSR